MFCCVFCLIVLSGCEGPGQSGGRVGCCAEGFRVDQIYLNPSFTKLVGQDEKEGLSDRIDVFVELRDQYGDPIKATGRFRFEFYHCTAKASADLRGKRFAVLQIDLTDPEKNQAQWDKITRSYRIGLELQEKIGHLVLQVTYMNDRGYRVGNVLEIGCQDAVSGK
ncbi:MAG: hypothetical protein IID32_07900 [Planctomycetes bacterium]|nr:hypothetical protein [Planctomycetota bacterium]